MEAEVQDCRRHLLDVCEEAVNERQKTQASLIRYSYSAVLVGEQDPGVSHYIAGHSKQYMDVLVCYFGTRGQVINMYCTCHHYYIDLVTYLVQYLWTCAVKAIVLGEIK